jgi:hypothetical protein
MLGCPRFIGIEIIDACCLNKDKQRLILSVYEKVNKIYQVFSSDRKILELRLSQKKRTKGAWKTRSKTSGDFSQYLDFSGNIILFLLL